MTTPNRTKFILAPKAIHRIRSRTSRFPEHRHAAHRTPHRPFHRPPPSPSCGRNPAETRANSLSRHFGGHGDVAPENWEFSDAASLICVEAASGSARSVTVNESQVAGMTAVMSFDAAGFGFDSPAQPSVYHRPTPGSGLFRGGPHRLPDDQPGPAARPAVGPAGRFKIINAQQIRLVEPVQRPSAKKP
jgi:hypothetical protein